MSNKGIYHWEIYDPFTKAVVSEGIGEEAERKTLSYLRSVYGSHLKSRGEYKKERITIASNPRKKKRGVIQVKNPTVLADTLDAFKHPPLASQLKPKEHAYLKKIQEKLRKSERLTEDEMGFLGDAMHMLMMFGLASAVPLPMVVGKPVLGGAFMRKAENPRERGHGIIRRIGRIGQYQTFPVWFEGGAAEDRPVMFDAVFQRRPEMRSGQAIEFDYVTTRAGWTVVRADFFVGPRGSLPTSPPPETTLTGDFTTGYVTKLKGEEEGEQPYRMAWAPRGQTLPGSLPGISGLKIPEDVTDTFNENRIREGMMKILPSYGRIMATGRQDGRIFVVTQIHDFQPEIQTRTLTIPLSELNYDVNRVFFDKDQCKGAVSLNLPFDSHPTLNSLKQHFEGDVTIRGLFKKEGFWDAGGEHHFFIYLGNTAEWSQTSIDNLKRIVRMHRETQAIHDLVEQYYASGRPVRFNDFVGGLEQILGRRPPVTEAERLLVTQRDEYEWEYIEALKGLAERHGGEYLYIPHRREPEFVFVINDRVILEIPVTNKASYIFNLDKQKGLEQQLTDIRAVPQRSAFFARTPEGEAIARELKYVGRVIHRTVDGWVGRVEAIVAESTSQAELEENPKGAADEVLARELALYAVNDSQIYHSWIEPTIKNLAHKHVQQVFNRDLALKGIAANARAIYNRYMMEVMGRRSELPMSAATKMVFAQEIYEDIEEAIQDAVREILTGERTRRGEPIKERQNTDVVQIKYIPPSMTEGQ